MNERLCEPLRWDDSHHYDRGKVMSFQDLEAGKEFGRYLDVDSDGIPYRTYPGTHRHVERSSLAARPRTVLRVTVRRARTMWRTCSGCCASLRLHGMSCLSQRCALVRIPPDSVRFISAPLHPL
jgi:hypothetical protein